MHPTPSSSTPEAEGATPAEATLVSGAPNRRPLEVEVVGLIQPYQARKRYVCPGCQGAIEAGEGHLVVVPEHTPDLRRHWHRGCWYREQRRRRGREA